MMNRDDRQDTSWFVDPVDHPEVTATCAVQAFQVEAQWVTDALRIVTQASVSELHAGHGDLRRESVERSERRRGPLDIER